MYQGKFNEEMTVEKVKQLLAGLNYKEVTDSGCVDDHNHDDNDDDDDDGDADDDVSRQQHLTNT